MTMKILADENIPYAKEAFASLGKVTLAPSHEQTPEAVKDAEILLIRSVTKVNEALLAGSKIRYVGTATIGVDHVDQEYLASQGIHFASAPGCNANSVSEYFTAALLRLSMEIGFSLRGKTLGIVGVGNVGSRVAKKAEALGMRILLNDPPRARAEGDANFVSLETILAESDLVTVHVPLTKEGEDKTLGLADAAFFAAMKQGAVFMNSSRGKVVQEEALCDALENQHLRAAILDVWESEPALNTETMRACFIATPHIAGYSFDGKVTGTRMIQDAAREALGVGEAWDPTPLLPAAEVPEIALEVSGRREEEVLDEIVSQVYPIREDDARMRDIVESPTDEQGAYFRKLRKEYPRRREFQHTRVHLTGASESLLKTIEGLGFAK